MLLQPYTSSSSTRAPEESGERVKTCMKLEEVLHERLERMPQQNQRAEQCLTRGGINGEVASRVKGHEGDDDEDQRHHVCGHVP